MRRSIRTPPGSLLRYDIPLRFTPAYELTPIGVRFSLPLRTRRMALDLTALLADLVAIPSVNPMGRDVEGPEFLEYRMTEYLEGFCKRLGLRHKRYVVSPKRENVVIRVDGDGP